MFGGAVDQECWPWAFNCTMYDYFVKGDASFDYSSFYLIDRMQPKTSLTLRENNEIIDLSNIRVPDVFEKGLSD